MSLPRGGLWLAIGLSLFLHALIATLAMTLLPRVAHLWAASPSSKSDSPVLMFRFRERTAEVRPESRTDSPPDTPLLGEFASRAQDRVPGPEDTPFPAGMEFSTENLLPEVGSAGNGSAEAFGGQGSGPGGAEPDEVRDSGPRPRVVDALASEVAMLTGKPAPSKSSRPARTDSEAAGALQFGDFAFSTLAWDFEPYWHYMRGRLYANWHPPAAYRDYGLIRGGWTVVRAVLDRQGRLRDAKILGSHGHTSLHPASFAAMTGAAPFRPLPKDFPEDSLVVTVKFIYQEPAERSQATP